MALPEVAAAHSLSLLFNSQRINRLAQQQARSDAFYGLDALLAQTYQQVFEQKIASGIPPGKPPEQTGRVGVDVRH